jgi:hypothetical protein
MIGGGPMAAEVDLQARLDLAIPREPLGVRAPRSAVHD